MGNVVQGSYPAPADKAKEEVKPEPKAPKPAPVVSNE